MATTLRAGARRPAPFPAFRAVVEPRALGVLAVIATYGLIVLGGTVRATDSGTACPDWPLCHGQVVPPLETKVMIEYAHRVMASIVGFMILGTLFVSWRRYPESTLVKRLAIAIVALLAGQVILGGVTVETETDASIVALHLSIALAMISLLIILVLSTFELEGRPAPAASGVAGSVRSGGLLQSATLAGLFVLIILGAYVSQEGAGLVYPDWPLFDGKLVSAGGRLADLHYAHRVAAALVGILLVGVAWQGWDEDRRPLVIAALGLVLALYAAQVIFGALQIWLELATWVRIVHLALASAVWSALVFALAYRYLVPPVVGANGVRPPAQGSTT